MDVSPVRTARANVMDWVLEPSRTLVDPLQAMAPAVSNRRWLWPMLFLMLTGTFSASALAIRWDAPGQVVKELTASGELKKNTEQEIQDKIQTQARIRLVAGI